MQGGRWNSVDVAVAYASESRALAVLEVLVHIDRALAPNDYVFAYATIPDDLIVRLTRPPDGWRVPDGNDGTRAIGDTLVREAKQVVLAVPSVVIPSEWNFIISPAHPDFSRIALHPDTEPFFFDDRLFA